MDKMQVIKDIVIEKNIKMHAKEAHIYEIIHPQLFNWYHNKKNWNDLKYIFYNLIDTEERIRILDLGCGTGFLTLKTLMWQKTEITAVDLSKEMLSMLEKKIDASQKERITLINSEAVSFLKSNSVVGYDIVMTSALMHHLVDLEEFIELSIKNLKPKGIFYIAYEPLKQDIDNKIRFFFHRIVKMIDMYIFTAHMKLSGITIEEEEHEKSMADYQTTKGGIDAIEIMRYLRDKGTVLKYDRFATRAYGIMAFIADKIIRSQNTFPYF